MARRSKITGTPQTKLVAPEIGSTGLKQWGGYVREEFQRELQGARGVKAYQEMGANSAVIGSGLAFGRLLASMVKWEVEPFSMESEDKARAEFFQSCMDDMTHPWEDMVDTAFSMLQFGFAVHEIVLKIRDGEASKYDDGLIGWAKLPLRPQDSLKRWEVDANGVWTAMIQQSQADIRERRLPRAKVLNFRTRTEKDNPEGVSALRHVYFTYYWWKRMQETEGIGVERSIAGFPVIGVPAELMDGTHEDKVAEWRTAGENIRGDEDSCLVMPLAYQDGQPLYTFKLESAAGGSLPDTSAIIERLERRMAQSLGTDFQLLGHEGVGSYALGDSKIDSFELAVEGHIEHVAKPVRQELFPLTMRLNGWPVERTPRLKHCPLEKADLAGLGDFIAKMIQVRGLTPDDDLETYLREQANLPERDPASPKRELPMATQTKPEGGKPDEGKPPESKPEGPNEAAA